MNEDNFEAPSGSFPFKVIWDGSWILAHSVSRSTHFSKQNQREIDPRNYPLPEFPGFQSSTKAPFDDRQTLADFLHEKIASLFYNPSGSTKTFGVEVTDLIIGLQKGLEGLARSGDEDSSHGLLRIAERATAELERELDLGNTTLLEKIRHRLIWPSHHSVNGGIQNEIFENLEEKGFGEKLKSRFGGKKLTSYAHNIVNILSPYMSKALPEVDQMLRDGIFESVPENEISPVLLILKDLPRKLTLQTVPDWFIAGEEILKLMAGCDNYQSHPYLKAPPFTDRAPENWNRDMRNAWKVRAS